MEFAAATAPFTQHDNLPSLDLQIIRGDGRTTTEGRKG